MLQAFYEYLMILDYLFSVKNRWAFAEQRKSTKQKNSLSNGGKNTCKWYNQQGVKIQHMQTAHTIQYQKKQPNQKLGRRLE